MNYKPIFLLILFLIFALPTNVYSKYNRNKSEKCKFLKTLGYKNCKTPPGYEIDHIVPLCAGGADKASNMQLLPKSEHKKKTRLDLKKCK